MDNEQVKKIQAARKQRFEIDYYSFVTTLLCSFPDSYSNLIVAL